MLIKTVIFPILIFCSSLISCDTFGSVHSDKRGLVGGEIFNVLTYGAKPGSAQERETIFQGPCKSQFPITIQVQGTLQAVPDISAYSGDGWISFIEVHGLILTGGGTIDGRGNGLWQYNDCKTDPNCILLPASINMMNVSNAKVKSITLMDSMGFHMHVMNSYMIRTYSLMIIAPKDSPNADGIHISKSNTVKVSRSVIKIGDDYVSVGHMHGSTNVTINKITCGPGHGISVGSLGKEPKEPDVKGPIVKNCTLKGTTNGIRIKTYPTSDPSRAAGILFQDIIMDKVLNPIIIDQNYGTKSSIPSLVKIIAVNLMCSSLVPCQNVHFHNIDLQFVGNAKPTAICDNAKVGYSGVQFPPPC
ncbi:Polygalacturonase [Handroanthus impetiginosus]|uniref:Polygalacturonase n=1 Tax=Handroanthus impetiginosus TaxID=429701 RepID=A0A2G9GM54_9LAMI|nr:Polygalacturonase [Handroanthus impetiginosus]